MLKSYEAAYHNGHLHWLGMPPPREIEKRHVMVVVDLENKAAKPTPDIRKLLHELAVVSSRYGLLTRLIKTLHKCGRNGTGNGITERILAAH
jgi:hypothetical protein